MTSSKKLEKIARQYRIDPATLPPVDGKSVTYNVKPSQPALVAPQTKEARQSEFDKLRAEAHAVNERMRELRTAQKLKQ